MGNGQTRLKNKEHPGDPWIFNLFLKYSPMFENIKQNKTKQSSHFCSPGVLCRSEEILI